MTSDKVRKRMAYILKGMTLLVVWLAVVGPSSLLAQTKWAPERSIPEYNDPFPPLLIADRYGVVHAFNTEFLNEQRDTAVFYRQWTLAGGWTSPVDILLPPERGVVRVKDVFLDDNDIIHIVFFSGNLPDTGTIYYTYTSLVGADNAQSWADPLIVGERAGPLEEAAIVGDDNGRLVIVYAGRSDGVGLYEVHSIDSGQRWSRPAIVFLWQAQNQQPASVWLTLDEEGQFHAIWSVTNDRALGEKIYYARLDADMQVWSIPLLLAERTGDEYSANWPSMISYNGELFVIYMDSAPPTRYMRRSADGGKTWSEPVRIFSQIGEYGRAVFLVDSNNTLHLVLGNRYSNPEIHGMWHSVWDGQRWSEPLPIASGPKAPAFDPSRPRAVISQGNVMLVSWWHDATSAFYPGYSFTVLDAPAIETILLTTPVVTAESVATEATSELITPAESSPPTHEAINTAVSPPFLNENTEISTPGTVLLAGVISSILFVLAATAFTIIVRQRR